MLRRPRSRCVLGNDSDQLCVSIHRKQRCRLEHGPRHLFQLVGKPGRSSRPGILMSSVARYVLAVAAALLATLGLLSCGRSSEQTTGPATINGRPFGVLATPAQTAPLGIQRQLRKVAGTGQPPYQVHKASTPVGPIWIWSGGNSLCILAGDPPAISCALRQDAAKRGITLGVVEHPGAKPGPGSKRRFDLYGVVPNRIRSVHIRRGSSNELVYRCQRTLSPHAHRNHSSYSRTEAFRAPAVRRCAGKWWQARCHRSA